MVHFSLFLMGHRPHYRASLGTTIRNDVSHSLPSMLQEDHRRHSNLHVDKCFGMGRLVFSVCIVDMGLWRWASSQTRFPIMQRDICCAKYLHRRSFLLPSWWSCHLSYAFAPHVMSEPKCISCRLLYGCHNVSSWECVHLSVFATCMTRAMVLAHHRILCGRVPQQKVSTGCWEGPQIVVIGTVM